MARRSPGVRVSLSLEPFWNWAQTDVDGTFEVSLPAAASGAAVVGTRRAGSRMPLAGIPHSRGVDGEPRPRITGGGGRRWSRRDPHRTADSAQRVMRQRETAARHRAGVRRYSCPIDPSVGRLGGRVPRIFGGRRCRSLRDPPSRERLAVDPADLRLRTARLLRRRRFTTQRVDAARLEVAAGETEIEVRLPASVQDLCDSQDSITGVVHWPDGQPAEGSGSTPTSSTTGKLSGPTEPSNSASRRARLRLSSRCTAGRMRLAGVSRTRRAHDPARPSTTHRTPNPRRHHPPRRTRPTL